jgi:non-specific serine/threonine protein kinase
MSSVATVTFGHLLRRHRLAAGLTQEALAERAGLSVHGIQKLERGTTRPYRDTANRLALALQLLPEDDARLRVAVEPIRRRTSARVRASGDARHNLPLPLTSLVGRDQDLADVTRLLTDARLLTLTGVGGCGKTRLAIEIARMAVDRYPDGVWLVELGPLVEAALVAQRVGAVVGVPEGRGPDGAGGVAAALLGRKMLLVLDNCEHLLEETAVLVHALLQRCPGVQVLATSREPIGVAGETAWRVPSLGVPGRQDTLDQLEHLGSVQLFVERAQAAQPRFALTARNASAVAQICQRLDGIPLALELAAARIDALTPEKLMQRLDQRFRLLTGGSRAALPRQQTLSATLDWSYDVLSKEERDLFERLAVFTGGWTLEAAEAVCQGAGIHADDVLQLMLRLVRKSLVVVEETGTGQERYRLLETVRDYARQKLVAHGITNESAVHERHAAFYRALAEQRGPEVRDLSGGWWGSTESTAAPALDELEAEHDNLRAALTWFQAADRPAEGLALAVALSPFWILCGHYGEARTWLETLLELAVASKGSADENQGAVPDAGIPVTRRALALRFLGTATSRQGDYPRAQPFYEASAALWREMGDSAELAFALALLGMELRLADTTARAYDVLSESLELSRATGDQRGLAQSLRNLGIIARWEGNYSRANTLLAESLTHAQLLPSFREYNIARARSNLGRIAYLQGDLESAIGILRQTVELIRAARLGGHALGDCLDWMAAVTCAAGHPVRAARLFGAAQVQWEWSAAVRYTPDQTEYEHDVATTRSALDEQTFASAWARGRALSAEHALAEARLG